MHSLWKRFLIAVLALAGTIVLTGQQPALAQATDVVCDGCVDAVDLAADAVYAQTKIVRADGTPAENGVELYYAIAYINDNSADKRYLIQLDAGIYDIDVLPVSMKPYVDLQGSGINTTKITSAHKTYSGLGAPTLGAVGNSEIRNLTIENSADGDFTGMALRVVQAVDQSPALITDVAIRISNQPRGGYGIVLDESTAILRNVSVESSGYQEAWGIAVFNDNYPDRKVVLDQVTVVANAPIGYGMVSFGSTVVRNSIFRAATYAVRYTQGISAFRALFVASEIDGPVYSDAIDATVCISSYDAAYNVLPANCGAF